MKTGIKPPASVTGFAPILILSIINIRIQQMNEEIIKLITGRLELGAKKYGKPNMNTDGRCFLTEALEEALDMSVYLAARLIEIKKTNSDKIIEQLYNKCCVLENKLRDYESDK